MKVKETYIVEYKEGNTTTVLYWLENGKWMLNIPNQQGVSVPPGTFRLREIQEDHAQRLIDEASQ